METRDSIAKKMRQLRIAQGLVLQDVADALGVTSMTVSRWERGLAEPDADTFLQICRLLNAHVSDFYDEEFEGLTQTESQMVNRFRILNTDGQKLFLELLDILICSGKYSQIISRDVHSSEEKE